MDTQQCSFSYTASVVDALDITLSPGRLYLYQKFAEYNDTDALRLYCWNTTLSQILYWPLHTAEISLRNAMADLMFNTFGDDWYDRISTFHKKQSVHNDEVEHIEKAKRKLNHAGLPHGHDNIVAAVSLGFWEGLLEDGYEKTLWDPLFSAIFPISRTEAFRKVNQIKRLRNNIAHHEPIFVFLPSGDTRLLYLDYKLILKIIRWICPETAQWTEYHSSRDFFMTWNAGLNCLRIPQLNIQNSGEEANSQKWRFNPYERMKM